MRKETFENADVEAVFESYPAALRKKLLRLRRLIFETAAATPGVGAIEETLKWGQPSYATAESGSGSPIRIDRLRTPGGYALFVPCQTNLVATFRELYPSELKFGGARSILFGGEDHIPEPIVRHCIALALTYRLRKSAAALGGFPGKVASP